MIWAIKNFPSVTRRCRCRCTQNLCHAYSLNHKSYRIQISATLSHLCEIDALHTQNFEILKSLEKTQESKKLNFFFEIFGEMLESSNFDKRWLLGSSNHNFFQNLKFLKFTKSVWVWARELKFGMNVLCYRTHKSYYSGFGIFEIHLRVFALEPEIFLKKGQYFA